jgi:NTP pyrophosphatase (non-canonical NTP hydrolase)
MNGTVETKSEIRARIDELAKILDIIENGPGPHKDIVWFRDSIQERMGRLHVQLEAAEEDLSSSIIRSHKAICKVKQMDEKAAYGNDPAIYYTLGICGEAGEMANAIVKASRNGADREKVLEAVKSELPDVIIYSYVLAYVLDIDLSKLVNDKIEVVIQRANAGYYGAPLTQPSQL